MKTILSFAIQFLFFMSLAPFLAGLITRVKNNLRMRQGQSIFQPYFNLAKLCKKDEVISVTSSWIFKVTPFIVFSSALAAALFVPFSWHAAPARPFGDLVAVIFILGLGRFFLALSAMDTGSSFGGMGASREMFVSSLAEPVALAAIYAVSLSIGTSDISLFGAHALKASTFIAAAALFAVMIVESSRMPVDNQETHLELTMIHEAMILEYSGRRLAILEMASYIKQMLFFLIIGQLVMPAIMPLGILIIAFFVALIEVSVAKLRLFRVGDFCAFAFVLSVVAIVCATLGV